MDIKELEKQCIITNIEYIINSLDEIRFNHQFENTTDDDFLKEVQKLTVLLQNNINNLLNLK